MPSLSAVAVGGIGLVSEPSVSLRKVPGARHFATIVEVVFPSSKVTGPAGMVTVGDGGHRATSAVVWRARGRRTVRWHGPSRSSPASSEKAALVKETVQAEGWFAVSAPRRVPRRRGLLLHLHGGSRLGGGLTGFIPSPAQVLSGFYCFRVAVEKPGQALVVGLPSIQI